MTQEEIIEMARQAGLCDAEGRDDNSIIITDHLEAFAKLVAAKATDEANARSNASWTLMCKKMVEDEREACAKEAEDSDHVVLGRSYHDQLGNAGATAKNIAVAIRNRGEAIRARGNVWA
jgi:hypothetical protein